MPPPARGALLPSVLMLIVVALLAALLARDLQAQRREADLERRLSNALEGYADQRFHLNNRFREVMQLRRQVAHLQGQLATGAGGVAAAPAPDPGPASEPPADPVDR